VTAPLISSFGKKMFFSKVEASLDVPLAKQQQVVIFFSLTLD
jgi:hypothetical protein